MQSGFAAFGTVFLQLDFIRNVNLVFFGNIILGFADTANQSEYLTRTFFCHSVGFYGKNASGTSPTALNRVLDDGYRLNN